MLLPKGFRLDHTDFDNGLAEECWITVWLEKWVQFPTRGWEQLQDVIMKQIQTFIEDTTMEQFELFWEKKQGDDAMSHLSAPVIAASKRWAKKCFDKGVVATSDECIRLRKFVEAVENTVEVCADDLYPGGKPCGKCGWCDINKALADLKVNGIEKKE